MRRRPLPLRVLLAVVSLVLVVCGAAEAASYKLARTYTGPAGQGSFGDAITVADGQVFIGARFEHTIPGVFPGAVYVHDASTGAFIRRVTSPVTGGQGFGSALAVVDGVLVVGEPYGTTTLGGTRGLVHYFDAASGAFIKTIASPNPNAHINGFGTTLQPVGHQVAAGAPYTDTDQVSVTEAYLLDVPSGDVAETLRKPDGNDYTGFGLALAPGGNSVAVASPYFRADSNSVGIAYVYDAASGDFSRALSNPEPLTARQFGWAMASLGSAVAIAAPSLFEGNPRSGAVFIIDPATGGLLQTLRAPESKAQVDFGLSLAPVGNLLLVGAPRRPSLANDGGGAFVFDPVTAALVWDVKDRTAPSLGEHVASDGRDLFVQSIVGDTGTVSQFIPSCGDGVLDSCETCDDGNDTNGDGCDADCTLESCGNGTIETGEQCDDGNDVDGDGCDRGCFATGCGNCVVTAGEECDDGNDAIDDHCDPNCTLPVCGNGAIGFGETCDDGNTLGGDGCSADCKAEVCGDQVVDAGESCDDGNHVAGDGCDADCHLETAKLDWWQTVGALPDTSKVILRGDVSVTPAGVLALIDVDFDVTQAQLFDGVSGAILHTFPETSVLHAAFIDGDVWILDWSLPATLRRYDGTTFELRQSYVDPTGPNFGFTFALVGDKVLVQDTTGVDVFDAATGTFLRTLVAPDGDDPAGFGAVIEGAGTHAVVMSTAATYLFDPATGALVETLYRREDTPGFQPAAAHVVIDARVFLGVPDPDPKKARAVVQVFSGDDGRLLHTITPPDGAADLQFGRRGMAVVGGDLLILGTDAVHVFDPATYTLKRTIHDPEPSGCFGDSIVDSPFGLMIGDICHGEFFDGIVYLFDHEDGHLIAALPNAHGGDNEAHVFPLGAFGKTLLLWHQEDEDGFGAVAQAFQPCDDGVLEPGEECDDGNLVSGDGCDISCTLTRCGNGIVSDSEECDDGNRLAHDGCENDCTRSTVICDDVDARLDDTRAVVRHLDEPSGDETLTLTGHFMPPAGTTFDPADAATLGAQVRIVDAQGVPLLDLTAATTPIPPLARGVSCDPRDGWRASATRAVYTNASDAIDATCVAGSAHGLRRLEIRRRAKDGALTFRLRLGPSAIPNPGAGIGVLLSFGSASSAPCGADTVQPLACEANKHGTVLTCR